MPETPSAGTGDPAGRRSAPDATAVIRGVLQGAAGIGALAVGFGFVVVTARLVAAELPVMEGLEAFGVRTIAATGVRALALLFLVCIVVLAALTPFVVGRRARTPPTSSAEIVARRLIVGMSLLTAPIVAFGAVVVFVVASGTSGNGWLVSGIGLLTAALAVTLVRWTLDRQNEPPRWVRVVGLAPWPPLMLWLSPAAVGIAGSLFVLGIAWFTLPDNARRLDHLAAAPPGTFERVIVAVFIASGMVWYASFVSLTPPTVFNLAKVALDDGTTLTGAYIGRSDGAVVLARCTADTSTVDAVAPSASGRRERGLLQRRRAFSRDARFLSVPLRHIRWVRVTGRGYVFDPGRSRTALGALLAVTDAGPNIDFREPWITLTDVTASKPVCGGG